MLSNSGQTLGLLHFVILGSAILFVGWATYLDAKYQDVNNAVLWGVGMGFLIPFYPLYLIYRSRKGPRSESVRTNEKIIRVLALCTVVAAFAGAIVAPPDPVTQGIYSVAAIPVGLVLGYIFIWKDHWQTLRHSIG